MGPYLCLSCWSMRASSATFQARVAQSLLPELPPRCTASLLVLTLCSTINRTARIDGWCRQSDFLNTEDSPFPPVPRQQNCLHALVRNNIHRRCRDQACHASPPARTVFSGNAVTVSWQRKVCSSLQSATSAIHRDIYTTTHQQLWTVVSSAFHLQTEWSVTVNVAV